jgi:hypothetical protein
MTDDTRKDQEKQNELTEKDLDKASGGADIKPEFNREAVIKEARKKYR